MSDIGLDLVSSVDQCWSICWTGSVKVDAMSAIVTVDQDCFHAALVSRVVNLSHASPLPWVLNCIGKNDVSASDVKTTIEVVVIPNFGVACILSTEYGLAEWRPILWPDKVRAHGVIWVGDLEPPELSAHLPCPLSHVLIDVIGCVQEQPSIIAFE